MRSVQLYGPTNFAQLIETAAQIAQAENQYTVRESAACVNRNKLKSKVKPAPPFRFRFA
jgi:hypothetical protein